MITNIKSNKPEGHSAIEKALACHAGGQGLEKFTVLLSSRLLHDVQSFSLTMSVIMCSSKNTCHGEGKKRASEVKIQCHIWDITLVLDQCKIAMEIWSRKILGQFHKLRLKFN